MGVTYSGTAVTKAMLTTILYFVDRFDAHAIELFRAIEFKHGREVLTAAYSKLSRLGALAGAVCVEGMSPPSVACYFLEYLLFALNYEIIQARDVTTEWLDKQKDGTPGAVSTVIGRLVVFMLVGTWVEDLAQSSHAESLRKELQGVMPMFDSYPAYEKAFPVQATAAASDEGDDDAHAEPQGTGQDEDRVDVVKKGFKNLASHAVIDFLYDLLAGVHDKGDQGGRAGGTDAEGCQVDGEHGAIAGHFSRADGAQGAGPDQRRAAGPGRAYFEALEVGRRPRRRR